MRVLCVLAFFILSCPVVRAATFCVDSAASFQAALNTAQGNGEADVVRLVQGMYAGNFQFLVLEGSSDLAIEGGYTAGCASRVVNPANTILDGQNIGTSLRMQSPSSVLRVDGVTIRNGFNAGEAGGLLMVTNGGTGPFGAVTLSNSTIQNNYGHTGGAILTGAMSVVGTTFAGNGGEQIGGLFGGSSEGVAVVQNSRFYSNAAQSDGFYGPGAGGAMIAAEFVIIDSNVFVANSNPSGGGMTLPQGSATIVNNLFARNSADEGGAIKYSGLGDITLTNNTIAYNSLDRPGAQGGGVYINASENHLTRLFNNIIWGNGLAPTSGVAPFAKDLFIDNDSDGDLLVSPVVLLNNDFDQSTAGFYVKIPFSLDASNFDNIDPQFVSPVANDYRLQAASPLINQGNNFATALPATDLAGNPRVAQGTVDLGAFEFSDAPCLLNVQPSYSFGTLNIGIQLATNTPAQWTTVLATKAGLLPLWNVAIPAVNPTANANVPIPNFPSAGMVGVLSMLSTGSQGLICWDFEVTDTGGSGATIEQLKSMVRSQYGVLPK